MNNLMRRSGIVAVLCLMLCLCLLICSCGGDKGGDETTADPNTGDVTTADPNAGDNTTEPDGDNTTEPDGDNTTEPAPTTVTYTVTVKNAAGEALANVSVQLCSTTCVPGKTDASGVATFELPEDVYQASITAAVEGYVVDTAKKYDFAEGATSLVIVLEAAPVVEPDDGKVDLRKDENVESFPTLSEDGDVMFAYIYDFSEYDEELWEYVPVAVKKGDSTVYVFEAVGDGLIFVDVEQGLGVKVSVKNVTTGTTYLPLSGIGELEIPVAADNTYEITVEYTLDEEVLYGVVGAMEADGSIDAPFYLYEGLISTEVVIPEGETVWFYLEDYYLLIENPSVKVNVNGTIYAPDENGIIDMSLLGYPSGLIGISSSVADAKIEIELSGSCEEAPITIYYPEMLEELPLAGKTVYCQIINESGKDIFTITANGGKIEALGLDGRNGSAEAVDTNDADDVITVDAAGYNVLYFVIEGATDAEASVEVPAVPGSERDPFELTFTEGAATLTITKEMVDEIGPQGFMGYAVWYSYTATANGTVTLTVPQIEGAGMWDLNGVDCPYGIVTEGNPYNYELTETGMTITLSEGDSVCIAVVFGSAQYEAGTDLVVTATFA